MKRTTRLAAAALTAALALPAVAADESGAEASFNDVSVVNDKGTIVVTGSSSFNGETVAVGEDAAGDAGVPGADLATLSVGQDPSNGELTFTMGLHDGLPTTGTLPVGAYYEWHIDVPGTEGVALRANFTEYDQPGGFVFSVTTFSVDPTTGNSSFYSVDTPGEYTGSELIWYVSPATMGASEGSKLLQGSRGPTRSGLGIVGFVTFPGISYDEMFMEKFVVGGGARVVVTDAAGEEVETKDARVRRGTFTASISDLPAGKYTVDVITEYGDASTTETFTVTI